MASGQVILVTGDRLTVSGGGYSVTDNPARRGIKFYSYVHNGHLNVLPSDAAGLVGLGTLDARLFDVTALLESGLGGTADLPLIVTREPGAGVAGLTRAGAKVDRELSSIRGLALRAGPAQRAGLWRELTKGNGLRPGLTKVWLDGLRRTTLDQSVPQIGAPTAWAAGFDGTGTKVAVVDSGIDATHPDLAGKVVAAQNFTTEPTTEDLLGHGTHVASIVAGTGAASGGAFRGAAPGASLLNAKVCTASGLCTESAILAGMEWAAQQGADVINMSLSGPDAAGVDPLEQAVNALTTSHGTLFVISSGNTVTGAQPFSVGSPSTADAAVSVGAVDPGDGLAFFSNRGPRAGDTAIKPDITAPGVAITAARSSTSSLPGDLYTDQSGTSMAAPHVAGAAAILAQRRPTWTPAQLKAALMGSATANPDTAPVFFQGAGRVDVARAYTSSVLADPPSVSLGRQNGPHEDDPVLNRTITYTNTDTANGLTLALSLVARDPFGGPAPDGMFTLSATSLSLPPGGTASVTLTATTSVAGPDGFYGGYVTATGPSAVVNTPFAVDRGPEGAEVTFNHRNRSGQFQDGYFTVLLPLTPGKPVYPLLSFPGVGPVGPRTVFIETGDYLFYSAIPEPGYQNVSVLVQPRLTITPSTTTMQLDAAIAQPVNVTVPNPAAQRWATEVNAEVWNANPSQSVSVLVEGGAVWTAQLGPPSVFTFGFIAKLRFTFAVAPPGSTDPRNAPTTYHLAYFPEQRFPTGFTRTVSATQLARVDATIGRHTSAATGYKESQAHPGGRFMNTFSTRLLPLDPPLTRTEFYNTDSNVRWWSMFFEDDETAFPPARVVTLESALRQRTAGTTATETWNKPVYGPALGTVVRPFDWVIRTGNTIAFNVPMIGDSDGHAGHPGSAPFTVPGTSGQAVLKRAGVVIAEAPYPSPIGGAVEVPAAYSPYTLEVSLQRGGPIELGTQVSAVWNFSSSSVDPNAILRLPLWSVSLRPALGATNTAPAGTAFAIPLTAVAQPNSPVAGINTITVEYSTDDGATWQTATMSGTGTNRTATVTHPSMNGFVSLRATAVDFAGNSVTQTTIRAYKIG